MGQTVCCNNQRERSTPMDTLGLAAAKMDGSARNSTPSQVSSVSPDYGYLVPIFLHTWPANCGTCARSVWLHGRGECWWPAGVIVTRACL